MLLSLVYRLLRCLFGLLAVLVRSDLSKDAELLVLRHQDRVLRRQLSGRLRWDHAGRQHEPGLALQVRSARRGGPCPSTYWLDCTARTLDLTRFTSNAAPDLLPWQR